MPVPVASVPFPAPVTRLSSEHLSTIFLLALGAELSSAEHEDNWQHGQSPLLRLPLVVSQVSKQWRTCALQTPELWRVVQCGFVKMDAKEEWRWVRNELTRLWMERARDGAIELWVVTGPVQRYKPLQVKQKKGQKVVEKVDSSKETAQVEFMVRVLWECLPRCERLRVTLGTESTAAHILKAISDTPSDSITTVELCKPRSLALKKTSYSPDMFVSCWPHLRHLTLIGLPPPTSLPPKLLSDLHTLRIEGCPASSIDIEELVACLGQCPELRRLRVEDVDHDAEDPEEDGLVQKIPTKHANLEQGPFAPLAERILLPELASLHLCLIPMFWARVISDRVAAPALRDVAVAQFYMDGDYAMMSAYGLPSATLGMRKMDLSAVERFEWLWEENGADLTNMLDVRCLLGQLVGVRTMVWDTKLSVLVLHVLAKEPTLCPKLDTLCGGLPTEELVALLEARRKDEGVFPIRTLRLSKDTPAEEVERLRELMEDVTAYGDYRAYEDLAEEDGMEGRIEAELRRDRGGGTEEDDEDDEDEDDDGF